MDGNHSLTKNKLIQDSEENEENRYPTKQPSEAYKRPISLTETSTG
jgi:hypothetical protein